jgi:hypothetical protein
MEMQDLVSDQTGYRNNELEKDQMSSRTDESTEASSQQGCYAASST